MSEYDFYHISQKYCGFPPVEVASSIMWVSWRIQAFHTGKFLQQLFRFMDQDGQVGWTDPLFLPIEIKLDQGYLCAVALAVHTKCG
jgi:hypothetical protein